MRAVAFLLAILAVTAGSAYAQDRPEYGFKVGPTFATLDFGEETEYGLRTSAGGGVFFVFRPNQRVALQLEGLYRPGGAKLKGDVADVGAAFKFLFNYFEVPILARLNVTRSPSRAVYIFGGPAPALRLSAKAESSTTASGFTSGTLEDVSEQVKRFDLGLVAGAGVDIGAHIVVDGRYTWGMMKINDTDEESIKNRTLMFLVGFRF